MKRILILLILVTSINFGFAQDKLGFGNMPDGVDSAGFGTVTTWVKKASECTGVTIFGECYDTVRIGAQTWIAKNLHYNDMDGGVYSYNDDTSISDEYGYLYTWDAATRVDLLINGWHLPSLDEMNTLITHLGGSGIAGGKLKEAGYTHWISPNTGATNESGFTAIGSGQYDYDDLEYTKLNGGFWMWSTTFGEENYSTMSLNEEYGETYIVDFLNRAVSVRLIKD